MLFNSISFLLFFLCVVFIYYCIIPKKYQYILLFFVSYYFYMCWNVRYAFLMLTSTVITFLSGIGMEFISNKYTDIDKQRSLKKFIVFVSIASNLSILIFFKYSNFIIENINLLLFENLNMSFDVVLPVGISFYTFQALSYTVDVYRGG